MSKRVRNIVVVALVVAAMLGGPNIFAAASAIGSSIGSATGSATGSALPY